MKLEQVKEDLVAFKYYAILRGRRGLPKGSQTVTRGEGITKRSQRIKIPIMGWGHAKKSAKLMVLTKEIITLRISYQWMVQQVISS